MFTKRDFQQKRVYSLEGNGIHYGESAAKIGVAEAIDLIRSIYKRWAVHRPPVINFRRTKQQQRSSANEQQINLNVRPGEQVALATVLHETAHALAGWRSHHGPRFVGIYFDLLRRYSDIDVDAMRQRNRTLPRGKRVKIDRTATLPSLRRRLSKRLGATHLAAAKKAAASPPVQVIGATARKKPKPRKRPNPLRPLTPVQIEVITDQLEILRETGWEEYEAEGDVLREAHDGFLGRAGFDPDVSSDAISTLATYIDGEYGRRYYNTARRLYELAEAREAEQVLTPAQVQVITEYIAVLRERGFDYYGNLHVEHYQSVADGFIGADGFDASVSNGAIRLLAFKIINDPIGSAPRYKATARRLYALAEGRETKHALSPGQVAVIDDYIALMREKGDHFFGVEHGATLSNAAKGFIGAGGFDWWVDAFTIRTLAMIIKQRPLGSSSRYEIAARTLEEIAETRANRSLYAPA